MKLSPLSLGKQVVNRLRAWRGRIAPQPVNDNQWRHELQVCQRQLDEMQDLLQRATQANPLLPAVLNLPSSQPTLDEEKAIAQYVQGGSLPWTHGYAEHKKWFVARAIADEDLLTTFRHGGALSAGYGWRLDERCVEFPWALAHLRDCGRRVFDGGSTLNHAHLLEHPIVKERTLIICTLAPEGQLPRPNLSYLYGDLRSTPLRDGCVDAVVSISTLEHIGMDNTMIYTKHAAFRECDLTAYRQAVAEFRRLLVPDGVALITVPFGKHQNHGWTQQFDRQGVQDIIDTFGGRVESLTFYRYRPDGWVMATAEECADCNYFNIHATPQFDPDHAAAARAVACLRLELK
ncbi:MAG: class I SAM-dependent methyltransferase [Planctomycetes bacterium]|nr:class I SAM-dependent methyltransferase [Planctomycetota bacterium]